MMCHSRNRLSIVCPLSVHSIYLSSRLPVVRPPSTCCPSVIRLLFVFPSSVYCSSFQHPSIVRLYIIRLLFVYISSVYCVSIHHPSIVRLSIIRILFVFPSSAYCSSFHRPPIVHLSIIRLFVFPSSAYCSSIHHPSIVRLSIVRLLFVYPPSVVRRPRKHRISSPGYSNALLIAMTSPRTKFMKLLQDK